MKTTAALDSLRDRRLWYSMTALCFLAASAVLPAWLASADDKKPAEEKKEPAEAKTAARPSFEELLLFNGDHLFGGKPSLLGDDKVQITFNAPGQMPRGFEGPGIHDPNSATMTGANRRFIQKKVEKDGTEILHENLAVCGLGEQRAGWQVWTSRFALSGDVKVEFIMRLPGLINAQTGFVTRLYVDGKGHLESNFFQTAERHSGGSAVAVSKTAVKEYSGLPSKWFPRNNPNGVRVDLGVEGEKFKVNFQGKETVSLSKVGANRKGKVGFAFRKIAFTLQDLKISGKVDRAWCEAEFNRLEKEGKLRLKPPESNPAGPGAPAPAPPSGGGGK